MYLLKLKLANDAKFYIRTLCLSWAHLKLYKMKAAEKQHFFLYLSKKMEESELGS